VRGGNLQAYAVTSKTRLAVAPDIPTVDEAGLPGFYISVWHGLWSSKGTPKDVVSKGRDREVVADHQGGRHQGGLIQGRNNSCSKKMSYPIWRALPNMPLPSRCAM
jgi:hypothetical protein